MYYLTKLFALVIINIITLLNNIGTDLLRVSTLKLFNIKKRFLQLISFEKSMTTCKN